MSAQSAARPGQIDATDGEVRGVDVVRAIRVISLTTGPMKGWCRTIGMNELGLPELQVRQSVLFLAPLCCGVINRVADYMANSGRVVELGQRMEVGAHSYVEFQRLEPHEDDVHSARDTWTLVDVPNVPCDACAANSSAHVH